MPLVDKKTTNQMLESTCLLGEIKLSLLADQVHRKGKERERERTYPFFSSLNAFSTTCTTIICIKLVCGGPTE